MDISGKKTFTPVKKKTKAMSSRHSTYIPSTVKSLLQTKGDQIINKDCSCHKITFPCLSVVYFYTVVNI